MEVTTETTHPKLSNAVNKEPMCGTKTNFKLLVFGYFHILFSFMSMNRKNYVLNLVTLVPNLK